MSYRRT